VHSCYRVQVVFLSCFNQIFKQILWNSKNRAMEDSDLELECVSVLDSSKKYSANTWVSEPESSESEQEAADNEDTKPDVKVECK
jgi:hypothetical protein